MKKSFIRKNVLFILLTAAVATIGVLSNAFGLEITVKQTAAVKNDMIRLGDIARFEPEADTRVSQLRLIEISAAPLPGADITINKDLLIYKINPFVSGSKDILIKLPETLAVHRNCQLVSADGMKEIFMSYVKDHVDWSEDQLRFEDINTPGTISLAEGNVRWDVEEKNGSDLIGNVALVVQFSVDEKVVKKVPVSGKVSVLMDTIKAARKIERGRIIAADDITIVRERTLHYRKDSLVEKEDVIGKRTVRTIQAGQMVVSGMVENPPLVKKGDKVILKAESSQFKITASGEALQDGRSGDQVEVLNLQSGGKVFGTVRGLGLVEVFF